MRVAQLQEGIRVNAEVSGAVEAGAGASGAAAPARRKVLVIDDSSTIRRTAEIFLSQAGCQVLRARIARDTGLIVL